jgi:hypothetical protein
MQIILEIATGILVPTLAALLFYINEYAKQKGKNQALIEDNGVLATENERIKHTFAADLEKLKAEHQLEFARRRHQYEAKFEAYKTFFSLLDEVGKKANQSFQAEFLPILNGFNEAYLSASSADDNSGKNKAIAKLADDTMTLTSKYNESLLKIKQETNVIRLIASDPIISDLDELDSLTEKQFDQGAMIMKKMASFEYLDDNSIINPMLQEASEKAIAIKEKVESIRKRMKSELEII